LIDVPVCSERAASPRQVLLRAAALGGGAVILAGGWYVLRHVRAGTAAPEAVRELAVAACDAAERFRALLAPRARPAAAANEDAMFVHYGT
jgi:hypothetical protein